MTYRSRLRAGKISHLHYLLVYHVVTQVGAQRPRLWLWGCCCAVVTFPLPLSLSVSASFCLKKVSPEQSASSDGNEKVKSIYLSARLNNLVIEFDFSDCFWIG